MILLERLLPGRAQVLPDYVQGRLYTPLTPYLQRGLPVEAAGQDVEEVRQLPAQVGKPVLLGQKEVVCKDDSVFTSFDLQNSEKLFTLSFVLRGKRKINFAKKAYICT